MTVYVQAKDPGKALERGAGARRDDADGAARGRPGITVAMFRDPAGNAVGLISGV